jgi:magnesium transporter
MPESLSYASEKCGLPPGSLVHVGEVHDHEQKITLINYNKTKLEKRFVKSIEEIRTFQSDDTVTWVIIDGLKEVAIIDAIGQHFDIHALVLEDILNTHQRPKYEEFDNYLYLVIKALALGENKLSVDYEQVSLLLRRTWYLRLKKSRMRYSTLFWNC